MNETDISQLVRQNVRDLVPYSSARSEYTNADSNIIYLDANENSFGSTLNGNYNRYPDPLQLELKKVIASIKSTDVKNIFLGNGSDEPIDLLIRSFCEPGIDSIIVLPPTYGMYEVSAKINNVAVKKVPLTQNFQLNVTEILATADKHTKLLFICSPNNPTANLIDAADIIKVIREFNGIVLLDEAYIDFASGQSLLKNLNEYPNLLILQTFSKAWGLAGLRLGMAFASPIIIDILNKVKAPYNINLATQTLALEALKKQTVISDRTNEIIKERKKLEKAFHNLPFIVKVNPSDANFILIKVTNAVHLYHYLKSKGIIVRNRSNEARCENSLRITVGNTKENNLLIEILNQYQNG